MGDSARLIRRLRRRLLHRSDGGDGAPVGVPIAAGMGRSATAYGHPRNDDDSPEHDRRRDGVVFDPDLFPLGPLPDDEPALADNDIQPDPDLFRPWSTVNGRHATRANFEANEPRGGAADDEEDQGMAAMDQRGYITVVPRPTSEPAGPSII